jgi:hypothetical protein
MIDQPQQKAFETFADRLDVKKLEIRNGLLIMVMKSIVRPCLFCGQKDHSKLEWHHPIPKLHFLPHLRLGLAELGTAADSDHCPEDRSDTPECCMQKHWGVRSHNLP